MAKEQTSREYITKKKELGEVKIASDVVAAIAALAATEIDGVYSMAGNITNELIGKLGMKNLSKGVKILMEGGIVRVDMMVVVNYGYSIPEVSGQVQERVSQQIENMTGLSVSEVNVRIAGVKLEDAVMAIKGVSNEAAVSGANANEASRAMYNFAQALSAGYVKLIDWKSIENANMATVEFKTQLLESAVACGTLTKTADGMYKTVKGNVIDATHNFNDSLQDQWMTTEALVGTLRNYADETTDIGKKAFAAAQDVKTFSQLMDTLKEAAGSGWANTWEILFGDFD